MRVWLSSESYGARGWASGLDDEAGGWGLLREVYGVRWCMTGGGVRGERVGYRGVSVVRVSGVERGGGDDPRDGLCSWMKRWSAAEGRIIGDGKRWVGGVWKRFEGLGVEMAGDKMRVEKYFGVDWLGGGSDVGGRLDCWWVRWGGGRGWGCVWNGKEVWVERAWELWGFAWGGGGDVTQWRAMVSRSGVSGVSLKIGAGCVVGGREGWGGGHEHGVGGVWWGGEVHRRLECGACGGGEGVDAAGDQRGKYSVLDLAVVGVEGVRGGGMAVGMEGRIEVGWVLLPDGGRVVFQVKVVDGEGACGCPCACRGSWLNLRGGDGRARGIGVRRGVGGSEEWEGNGEVGGDGECRWSDRHWGVRSVEGRRRGGELWQGEGMCEDLVMFEKVVWRGSGVVLGGRSEVDEDIWRVSGSCFCEKLGWVAGGKEKY
ncbi:hypothetical protein Tco_0557142 [Tanacetum coccineum]